MNIDVNELEVMEDIASLAVVTGEKKEKYLFWQLEISMAHAKRIDLIVSFLMASIENIWSTLFMTGYLTQRRSLGNDTYELAIPNLEIRKIFQRQIYEWFKDFSRKDSSTLNTLCQAFAVGNAEEAQKQFTAFLRKTISIRDTYVKAAKKENFYHGILLGLLSYRDDWIVKSNVESSDGYSDIVIKIPDDEIGMIIEVKYGEDADMDKGCADALAQIERMNYSAILEDDEVLLSFSTTRQPVLISAILFMASYTIPPVKEPSPITAAIFSFVPLILLAHAIPSAAEIDVELCPVLNASHGLSLVFGKPLIPPNCLRVPISFFLPVSILWT